MDVYGYKYRNNLSPCTWGNRAYAACVRGKSSPCCTWEEPLDVPATQFAELNGHINTARQCDETCMIYGFSQQPRRAKAKSPSLYCLLPRNTKQWRHEQGSCNHAYAKLDERLFDRCDISIHLSGYSPEATTKTNAACSHCSCQQLSGKAPGKSSSILPATRRSIDRRSPLPIRPLSSAF